MTGCDKGFQARSWDEWEAGLSRSTSFSLFLFFSFSLSALVEDGRGLDLIGQVH